MRSGRIPPFTHITITCGPERVWTSEYGIWTEGRVRCKSFSKIPNQGGTLDLTQVQCKMKVSNVVGPKNTAKPFCLTQQFGQIALELLIQYMFAELHKPGAQRIIINPSMTVKPSSGLESSPTGKSTDSRWYIGHDRYAVYVSSWPWWWGLGWDYALMLCFVWICSGRTTFHEYRWIWISNSRLEEAKLQEMAK